MSKRHKSHPPGRRLDANDGSELWAAYANPMKAAEKAGRSGEVRDRMRTLVAGETYGAHGRTVRKNLEPFLRHHRGLAPRALL